MAKTKAGLYEISNRRQIRQAHSLKPSAAVLLICLFTTIIAAAALFQVIEVNRENKFNRHVALAHQDIENRLDSYLTMLRATKGYFVAAGQDVTREDFKNFISQMELDKKYPGLKGIGYSVRILPDEKDAFIESLRATGFENFNIWPDGKRDVYHAIVLLEPQDESNRVATGYDMYSEPVRRKAMEQARDTGRPAISDSVTLVQEINDSTDIQAGFLIYLPVYTTGKNPENLEDRRAKLNGFVYSPFRVEDIFNNIFGREKPEIEFTIIEKSDAGSAEGTQNVLYQSAEDFFFYRQSWLGKKLQAERILPIAGQDWTIHFVPGRHFDDFLNLLILVVTLMSGVFFSILVSWLVARQEKTKADLSVSEEKFRTVFNLQFQFMALLSPSGVVLDINELPLAAGGITREEAIGKYFWDCVWWRNMDHIQKAWPKRLQKAATLEGPFLSVDEYQDANGHVRIADTAVTAVKSERDEIKFFIVQAHDITEREDAEKSLREETRTLENMNALMRTMSSTLEMETLIQLGTNEATYLCGAEFGAFFYNAGDELGDAFVLYSTSGPRKEEIKAFADPQNDPLLGVTLRGEGSVLIDNLEESDQYLSHKSLLGGKDDIKSYLAVSVISRTGDVLGGMIFGHSAPGIFNDRRAHLLEGIAAQTAIGIDNARLYEQILRNEERYRNVARRAEAASLAKSDFLANMSHEIRTPMNVIIGLADILSAEGLPKEKKEKLLATLKTSSRQMMALIDDLLDIARIEAQSFELQKELFCPMDVITDVINLQAIKAEEKGLELLPVLDGLKECETLIGDPLRLRQILLNLLANAVKFTYEGHIRIQCECQRDKKKKILLVMTIEDTGIGIEQDKLGMIFEKFTQADNSITRQFGGSGLGLSIAKQLTEYMKGTITVESEVGKGTVFTVSIPFDVSGDNIDERVKRGVGKKTGRGKGLKILVVDDHEPNILVASHMLEALGYSGYKIAATGREALAIIEKTPIDVVLMDLQMPGIDGLTATRIIRENEEQSKTKRPVKIIGVTAHALADDREKCLKAGMDDYLAKPFRIEELKNILNAIKP